MKSGLLAGPVRDRRPARRPGGVPLERLVFVANPDEEIGSTASTPHIRRLAADSDACLVLECARANGDIVSSRKGTLDARDHGHRPRRARRRRAREGPQRDPRGGRSSRRDLHALNGRWPGVTVNVGVVPGGTRPNVVAERAGWRSTCGRSTAPDSRRPRPRSAMLVAAPCPGRHGRARGDGPPVADGEAGTVGAARRARRRRCAARLGFSVKDAATGGASDANTTSGMGVPTIDGLGPIGGLDHSPGEYLEVASIVPRTALSRGCRRDRARSGGRGLAGGAAREGGRLTGRPAARVQRRPVGGVRRLQPGGGGRRRVLRVRHDGRGPGRRVATSRRRGGPGSRLVRDRGASARRGRLLARRRRADAHVRHGPGRRRRGRRGPRRAVPRHPAGRDARSSWRA